MVGDVYRQLQMSFGDIDYEEDEEDGDAYE